MIPADLCQMKLRHLIIDMNVQRHIPVIHCLMAVEVRARVIVPQAVVTVDHHLVQVGIECYERHQPFNSYF